MSEIEILTNRIVVLEGIINTLVKPDRYMFEKNIELAVGQTFKTNTASKLGVFGATPVVQQTSTGITGNMGVVGGAAVTESNTFFGNGATGFTIGDIVHHLKAYGILPN